MPASKPLFAIVISEKGGAERRELFDRAELSLGRVQGNDLMLPKGNVSKRHARLVFRDGRFIVSDLNSTNGTYVNRRRISQATIVREGDRIYVGDFVLRIELSEGVEAATPATPLDPSQLEAVSSESSASVQSPRDASVLPAAAADPAQEARRSYPDVPGPPKLPGAGSSHEPASGETQFPASNSHGAGATTGRKGPERPSLLERSKAPERPITYSDDTLGGDAKSYRATLASLVRRVADAQEHGGSELPDEPTTESIQRLVREQLAALEAQHLLPRGINSQRLQADAIAELIDCGPLRHLLDDPDVSEVVVSRFDHVEARRGGSFALVPPGFSSEAALLRAIRRLAVEAGAVLDEEAFELRLPNGTMACGVMGPAAVNGPMLMLRKAREGSASLEQLVRAGSVSRAMASFLQQAVLARLNILVVGSRDASPAPLLSALALLAPEKIILYDADGPALAREGVLSLDLQSPTVRFERVLSVTARAPETRLVVTLRSSAVALAVLEATLARASGLIAACNAPNARRGLIRLPAELASARPGLPLDAARDWVSGTFDLVVELAKLRDGRERVLRISEVGVAVTGELEPKDVFVFVPDRTAAGGSIEGTFAATGLVPRSADDMNSRGFSVDSALFSRPSAR
jgi:pilus assembly protein CpaF